MTIDSKPSTLDPTNHVQVIYSDDEMGTAEKNLEYYYEAKIGHNHPNFHMIQEIVKEERKSLQSRIDLFKKYKLP